MPHTNKKKNFISLLDVVVKSVSYSLFFFRMDP